MIEQKVTLYEIDSQNSYRDTVSTMNRQIQSGWFIKNMEVVRYDHHRYPNILVVYEMKKPELLEDTTK